MRSEKLGQEGGLGDTPKEEMSLAKLSATIGRKLSGNIPNIDKNITRTEAICLVALCGMGMGIGVFIGKSMLVDSLKAVPLEYFDAVTKASIGGLIFGNAMLGGILIMNDIRHHWPRKKSG